MSDGSIVYRIANTILEVDVLPGGGCILITVCHMSPEDIPHVEFSEIYEVEIEDYFQIAPEIEAAARYQHCGLDTLYEVTHFFYDADPAKVTIPH